MRHGGYGSTTYAVDPFGWRGNGRDPLFDYNGKESSCLWAGVPGDDISCADIIVEDDGAGWDQYGSWTQSTAGNGYRQHWTYTWDPADYWVAWLPWYNQVRYPGYYQIHAFIPTANSTTSNARYQVHHYPYTTIKRVNQNNPDHFWASLGTHWLWPMVDYVSLDDYTGEPSWSKQIVADSMKFSASIVYLPDVRNSGGWRSSIVIRNNKTSSAQVAINYYNASGGWVSDQTTTVAGNGSTIRTPPSGFSGSAVVVSSPIFTCRTPVPPPPMPTSPSTIPTAPSSTPLAPTPSSRTGATSSICRTSPIWDRVSSAASRSGPPANPWPSSPTMLPWAAKSYSTGGGTWNGGLRVQNAGTSSTAVTVDFYDQSGNHRATHSLGTLAPGRSAGLYVPNVSGLPNGLHSAVVTAGQPLVAVGSGVCSGGCSGDTQFSYNGINR